MSEHPTPPRAHRIARNVMVFTSLLGFTHISLALSTWSQTSAFLGEGGLSPWSARASELPPSLLTLLSSLTPLSADTALHVTMGAWALAALSLTLRLAPALSALMCLLSALAVHQAGGELFFTPLAHLTHEVTLLSLLCLPLVVGARVEVGGAVSKIGAWVGRALLFKLTFMTGLTLLSSDPLWVNLKALYVAPWTQPLPHAGATWVLSLPEWALTWGASLTLYAQLCVPWLLFARVSRPALVWLATLALSAVSASLGRAPSLLSPELWLWVMIALASDERLSARLPQRLKALVGLGPQLNPSWTTALPLALLALAPHLTGSHGPSLLVMAGLIALSFEGCSFERSEEGEYCSGEARPPLTLNKTLRYTLLLGWCALSLRPEARLTPLKAERAELMIELSADGVAWAPLNFPYSPNASPYAPTWAGLHLPLLDLALWREARYPACRGGWLFTLLERLLEPLQEPQEPQDSQNRDHELWSALGVSLPELSGHPRWARVRRLRYELVLREGRLWRARDAGVFCPALSLTELRRARALERELPPLPSSLTP